MWQGNVFTPVCHSVHMGVSATPAWPDTPWADTPLSRHLPRQTPPLPGQTPPAQCMLGYKPCAVHAGMRSTSGRYACYWNAFLYRLITHL